jgi:hypothetical protein
MANRRGNTTDGPAEIRSDSLVVRVEGIAAEFLPGDEPVFGRGADIDVDDNPFLHRRLGRFSHRQGWWWLQNLGSTLVLTVNEPSSGAASRLPPGTQAILVHPHQLVRFEVGRTRYELEVIQSSPVASSFETERDDRGAVTIDISELPLNDEQRRLLVALCEHRLLDPFGPLHLPSNQVVADRLGWSITKLNRKLDWLCDRLARQGVSGMKEPDGRATRRRERLVEYAVNVGLVGLDDLQELDPLR